MYVPKEIQMCFVSVLIVLVDIFAVWLRHQTLPELLGHWDRPEEHQKIEMMLLKACVFAEQYDILGFKQEILDNFIRSFLNSDINGASMSGVPFFKTVIYAFNSLPSEECEILSLSVIHNLLRVDCLAEATGML